MMQRISDRLLTAALVGLLAGCAAPRAPGAAVAATPSAEASAPPRANQPAPECLAMLDRLSAGIPGDETGVVLRGKGLRIATPIRVPDGLITETAEVSAARVRVMIDRTGRVVPGSVSVQQSVGDPKLPLAPVKPGRRPTGFMPRLANLPLAAYCCACGQVPVHFSATS